MVWFHLVTSRMCPRPPQESVHTKSSPAAMTPAQTDDVPVVILVSSIFPCVLFLKQPPGKERKQGGQGAKVTRKERRKNILKLN